VNRPRCRKLGFTYTFLSDPKTEVIQRYDLLHRGGGPHGADIARPAEFLLDATGTIRWVNLTESVTVRARPQQVLNAFERR
jgi:peroxiredoxin